MSLPKLLKVSEKRILPEDSQELVVLQPKLDGCQAVLRPGSDLGRPEARIATTAKGNYIPRLQSFCDAADLPLDRVFFCEYEPVPWSESFKVKLAGNLYTSATLPFDTRLVAFDSCTVAEFAADAHRKGNCRDRLVALDECTPISGQTWAGVNFSRAPWTEMPYAEAHALCESSNVDTPDGSRCLVMDVLCEGGVIRHGNRAEKIKAKKDYDVAILYAVQSPKGQRGWLVVDTKDPSDIYPVFGGVPVDYTSHVGTVVEVVKLIVTGFKGAGNPTFTRSRANEKDFDCATFIDSHPTDIEAVLLHYKLKAL
jgi:hypothetical protein